MCGREDNPMRTECSWSSSSLCRRLPRSQAVTRTPVVTSRVKGTFQRPTRVARRHSALEAFPPRPQRSPCARRFRMHQHAADSCGLEELLLMGVDWVVKQEIEEGIMVAPPPLPAAAKCLVERDEA